KLSEVTVGQRVALKVGGQTFSDRYPDLPAVPAMKEIPAGGWQRKPVKIPTVMTEDLATWLGWFISEGCWQRDQDYSIGFCNFSKDVAQEFFWHTTSLFGITMMEYWSNNFTIGSTILKKWLNELGAGGLAAEKTIPDVILRSPKSCQKSFLRAMFEAEGSIDVSRKGVEIVTASEKMG